MRTSVKRALRDALSRVDSYFVETTQSHYSDTGEMWDLAMNARGVIAQALHDEGVEIAQPPWQGWQRSRSSP